MKIKLFIMLMLFIFVMTGCSVSQISEIQDSGKIQIVTTLFPQYDFAKAIGQDKVEVKLLLPPGIEAHSYEPTPQDVVTIQEADLFIYTGEGMEPWAHKTLEGIQSDSLTVVDSSKNVELIAAHEDHEDEDHEDEDHEDEDHEDEHEHGAYDPHIWTDPLNAIIMVDNILDALVEVDPINTEFYKENAIKYKDELQTLHQDLEVGLANVKSRTIIYGGHFAFGYFAHRYDLDHVSPYEGFAPDAEPTPQKIAEMIDLMNTFQVKTIFYEELIDPKVSRVIASETGAKTALLHGAHNVSKDELQKGITYITIMRENLERLKAGLNGE